MTPKLHPLEPRTQAPGGRVNPASPLPVPTTPASGWGRPGLSPPLPSQPRREPGQVPRALPKVLKSKTVTTQGELRQVGLRLSSATPLPPALAWAPADAPHPACWGGSRDSGVQSRAEGGFEARSFVRWDRARRHGAGGQPRVVRDSPENRAPRRPRSPPRDPAAASVSPLWPKHDARRREPVS